MAETGKKESGQLGRTAKDDDDEDSLGGTLADIGFGAVGPSPLGAVLGLAGAIAHAVMGTRPSPRSERSAMTMGLSNLEGLFDALESAGFSRANPGGILGGIRPDITDPAVQAALREQAAVGGTPGKDDEEGTFGGMRGAFSTAPGTVETSGSAVGSNVDTTSTRDPGLSDPNEGRGDREGGMGTGGGGDNAGGRPGGQGDRSKGDAFLVTKQHMKGPDPKGPDTGKISFTVQDGEMIWVFPREMVKRYGGPETLKKIFEAWRSHSGKQMKMPMPKIARKSAMG